MKPSDVLFVSLGNVGEGIVSFLRSYAAGEDSYHFLDLGDDILEYANSVAQTKLSSPQDYDELTFNHPEVLNGLSEQVKQHQRVFLLFGAEPSCGASLAVLRSIYDAMNQGGKELYLVLYLLGENAEPVSMILEKHLHGIFTNKARAGYCKIFITRENELANLFGHILTLKNISQRYYRQVAEAIHKFNLFSSSQTVLTRTNPVDMVYYTERENYANIMTFSMVVMEAEKLQSHPFFDLTILKPMADGKYTKHEEEFICLFLNLHKQIKDDLHKFLETIKMALNKEKNKKIQIDFYNITDTNQLTLGIHKTTITVE